jgi:hypothetical protein
MSGLELVAGIAGVAAAAIKVSVSMSKCRSQIAQVTCTDPVCRTCVDDLAEELGSAGRDVRYIGNDMAGFSQVSYGALESSFANTREDLETYLPC